MGNGVAAIELHDGTISAVVATTRRVTIFFSHLAVYFRTDVTDVFDVRSCQADVVIEGASMLEALLSLENERVWDGELTVDGANVEAGQVMHFEGACRVSLVLAGARVGRLVVDGTSVQITLRTVGRVFEQFHGPVTS